MNILRWLQCQDCGAEYEMGPRQNCDACAGPVHERTAHDGAAPTKLSVPAMTQEPNDAA